MRRSNIVPAAVTAGVVLLFPPGSRIADGVPWLCSYLPGGPLLRPAAFTPPAAAAMPTPPCAPAPTGYHSIQQAAGDGDLAVDLTTGADPSGASLCYVYNGVAEAPVIRVQRGHRLTIGLTNALQDTGPYNTQNCLLQTFVDGGACAQPEQGFMAKPGADDGFYPIQANVPHLADGTTNLHVHGMVVSPRPCHDEVIISTIYPANWGGPVGRLLPCQSAPDELTYTNPPKESPIHGFR